MFSKDILEGKTIWITGGGSGLGYAMAGKFIELGARVAICGRSEDKLNEAVNTLKQEQNDANIESYVCDVRDYATVESTLKAILEEFGRLDGLVNAAAGNFLSASEDLSPNAFKSVVDIVLQGTFNCTHAFGNYLINQKRRGDVLNIVTTYASTGSAFVLPSACAKSGVETMTKSLAYEWALYGIRLNAIAPGSFPTEGAWQRLVPDRKIEEAFINEIPMKRHGEHEELANLAVFLMSDMARYINGECLVIDGGQSLNAGQLNFVDRLVDRDTLKDMLRKMRSS